MDLPFCECVCVYKQVHSEVPALFVQSVTKTALLV